MNSGKDSLGVGVRQSDLEKAKEIILAIVQAEGGTFRGKTRLFKVFWLAHLYYYKDSQRPLSQWPIVKMPSGPGIDRHNDIFPDLDRAGLLSDHLCSDGPFPDEHEFILTEKGKAFVSLSKDELDAINRAAAYAHELSGKELSERSHREAYRDAELGKEIDIYLDLIGDDRLEKIDREAQALSPLLDKIFRGG